LGIGNEIKGDDGLGPIIAQKSLLLFDKIKILLFLMEELFLKIILA
jgi:Ni,Fe-hydrogenase maturation factor